MAGNLAGQEINISNTCEQMDSKSGGSSNTSETSQQLTARVSI